MPKPENRWQNTWIKKSSKEYSKDVNQKSCCGEVVLPKPLLRSNINRSNHNEKEAFL
jgi:hypothetical protein